MQFTPSTANPSATTNRLLAATARPRVPAVINSAASEGLSTTGRARFCEHETVQRLSFAESHREAMV